ncbi:MAG: HNH endonuclease [Patescibacteria group bacterium]
MEITKEILLELYVGKDMGLIKISQYLGVGVRRIRTLLTKYEIPSRPFHQKGRGNRLGAILSKETKSKISKAHMGKIFPESAKEKLRAKGKGWYMSNGYIFVRKPEHPMAYKYGGYIKRANIVLEEKIGRSMFEGELVHHINNIRDDDRPENLLLINSASEHNSLTAKERWKSGELRKVICNKEV